MTLTLRATPLPCAFLLAAAVGCANPQGDFDDFVARQKADQNQSTSSSAASSSSSSTGSGGGGSCLPMPGEADGQYLSILVANITYPKPLLLDTQITTAAKGSTLEVSVTLQAIDAHDGKTRVGSKFTVPPATAGSDGSITFKPGSLMINGNADPLLYGSEIDTTGVELDGGYFCKPLMFVCGTVKGNTVKPTPDDLSTSVNGHVSTWTMVPWDGKALPDKLYASCAMDEATAPTGM